MAAYKNIAIIGVGDIGKVILGGLVDSSKFNITVVSRKESTSTFPEGVKVYKTDYTPEDLQKAFTGQDVVISVLGAASFGEQTKLVDASIAAGVKRFLPSEFSANSQDPEVVKLLPIFQIKVELIKYLKSKESDSFSWTGLSSGPLFDWGLNNGFLEFDLKQHTATIWDGGDRKLTGTNEKALGEAVVTLLEKPVETKNKFLVIYSIETSPSELVKALEAASGKTWTVKETTTASQLEDAQKRIAAGDFTGLFNLVRATVFSNIPGLKTSFAGQEDVANDLLQVKQESLESFASRLVQ